MFSDTACCSDMEKSKVVDIKNFLNDKSKDLPDVDLSLIEKDIASYDKYSILSGDEKALNQIALVCSDKSYISPQWGLLAGRISIFSGTMSVPSTFSDSTKKMEVLLNKQYYDFVIKNSDILNSYINKERDDLFDFFAANTLLKSYLARLKIDEKTFVCETPQYMYMRVAVYLHYPDLDMIKKVYENLSKGNYTQATPTLFNSGMKNPQLSSCFLIKVGDSLREIERSWTQESTISAGAGAVGLNYSSIRHSEIASSGHSKGVIPWLTITDKILKAVDQKGLRPGSGTVYLRDCHIDIHEFVELRDEGPEDLRTRNLFLAVMVSDLFMKRIEKDELWSLFCPNKSNGLMEKWGNDFEDSFIKLEKEKKYKRQIPARELWLHILNMQIKTGMPFILFVDSCNRKSNHQHLGTITGSNLCTEILEYTSPDEIASCVLGSISLNRCVVKEEPRGAFFKNKGFSGDVFFDFDRLESYVAEMVENLDSVIDRNFYPDHVPEIYKSNMRHRPLGIGVQGFADALALMDISWVEATGKLNPIAKRINKKIFECMYYSAMKKSISLAKSRGRYPSFEGSPLSKGLFQFDLANVNIYEGEDTVHSSKEWDLLRQEVKQYGARHSLLIALMPTASSANILGNAECFEPFNALMYSRTVLGGQFMIVNKYMVEDLRNIGIWNTQTLQHIIKNNGSIQNLECPDLKDQKRFEHIKLKYKTIFEIPQRVSLDLAIDRSVFICQTSSQNCFMKDPTKTKLNAYHFYAWKGGLKTGMYYLRQKALVDPIDMATNSLKIQDKKKVVCNDEVCLVCQT